MSVTNRDSNKVCFKCERRKPLTDFYKHPRMKDGRLNKCKECAKRDTRLNRDEKRDYYIAYDAKRYKDDPERREGIFRRAKRYVKRNPEKKKAHSKVGNALRDGRLVQPATCESCKQKSDRIEAHHEDYAKPLDVRWLCSRCHHRAHHPLEVLSES